MLKLARRIIDAVNADRRLLALVLLINVAGFLFGLYYYWDQLGMTPWYLWLAVPDCPLYALLMAVAIGLVLIGRPNTTLNAITAVGATMYGAWTIIVLLYFGEFFFSPPYAMGSWERLISHGGLMIEGVLLLPYLKKARPVNWALTAAWFIILDSVDYFYHFTYNGLPMRTHPLAVLELYHLVSQAKVDTLVYLTFGLSALAFGLIFVLSRAYGKVQQRENAVKKEIRT